MSNAKHTLQNILSIADIQINGTRPWDIQVNNDKLFDRVLSGGSLALGESYMEGWWDVPELDEFFNRILRSKLNKRVKITPKLAFYVISSVVLNLQRKSRAFNIGEAHYDIGNDLYEVMLDKRMVYTCGYWKRASTLDEAQEHKLDLVCKKIGLEEGMTVLDIGCGWGSFALYAAQKYKANVVGITVSKEQAEYASGLCSGYPVDIRLQDYRDVDGVFDRIVSLGMIEHVGYKNYSTYMKIAHKNLADDGLFLLHTIGSNISVVATDPWIGKYIFPNGMVPSIKQLARSMEGLFVMEDWHNFGADYDKTLMAWFENFDKNWNSVLKPVYGDRVNGSFYRMWKYYLLSCAGSFRARRNQLWQIVLSKSGIIGGYTSIR